MNCGSRRAGCRLGSRAIVLERLSNMADGDRTRTAEVMSPKSERLIEEASSGPPSKSTVHPDDSGMAVSAANGGTATDLPHDVNSTDPIVPESHPSESGTRQLTGKKSPGVWISTGS